MNTNDELDKLTDAALSEAFAREVAGWRRATTFDRTPYGRKAKLVNWVCEREAGVYTQARFAISADAVLPFLEKGVSWHSAFHAGAGYLVTHSSQCGQHVGECDAAPRVTFARAACIALLRAKRAEKGRP